MRNLSYSYVAPLAGTGGCPRCGRRPATPRGTPILGATPYANLFLNCGHGALGWTQALGSARIVADRIAGATPAIPQDGFELGPR